MWGARRLSGLSFTVFTAVFGGGGSGSFSSSVVVAALSSALGAAPGSIAVAVDTAAAGWSGSSLEGGPAAGIAAAALFAVGIIAALVYSKYRGKPAANKQPGLLLHTVAPTASEEMA